MCPRPSGRSVSAQVLACASPSVEMRDGVAWAACAMSHPCPDCPVPGPASQLFIHRQSELSLYRAIWSQWAKKQKNESGARVCLPFPFFNHFIFSLNGMASIFSLRIFFLGSRLPFLLMDILFPVYPVSPDRWTMARCARDGDRVLLRSVRFPDPVPPAPRAIG